MKIVVCIVYKYRPNMVERAFVNQSIVKCYPIAREFAEEYIFITKLFSCPKS